jgi:predicted phage terminase large subunit-like protein
MNLTVKDIDNIEKWWTEKSRVNFLAYRKYIRHKSLKDGWFVHELSRILQNFYIDYKQKKRPVYIINTPPQHGKSWSIIDFVTWILGREPHTKLIFSAFTDRLGIRCNTALQRTISNPKYSKIFPTLEKPGICNSDFIEFAHKDDIGLPDKYGFFRNTTVRGSIVGDTIDIGIIDDPVKGKLEARSLTISENVWDWYDFDFDSRLSEYAGVLIVMTRWVTHDLTARIEKSNPNVKIFNFQAIAEKDEKYRKAGEPLFPELKSLEFLESKRKRSSSEVWGSLYQGKPTIDGGNLFKDSWWKWYRILPKLSYKFITMDTAQKTKTQNDYTSMMCWGVGVDNNLYLLDKIRKKFEAPDLRKAAEIFYRKHAVKRKTIDDPVLRGVYIEDKSSGSSLIQELQRIRIPVHEVQRNIDKYTRGQDASPFVELGYIYLNTEIDEIDNLLLEGREFPNGQNDDEIDNLMQAIEITYINEQVKTSLEAAMEAD